MWCAAIHWCECLPMICWVDTASNILELGTTCQLLWAFQKKSWCISVTSKTDWGKNNTKSYHRERGIPEMMQRWWKMLFRTSLNKYGIKSCWGAKEYNAVKCHNTKIHGKMPSWSQEIDKRQILLSKHALLLHTAAFSACRNLPGRRHRWDSWETSRGHSP